MLRQWSVAREDYVRARCHVQALGCLAKHYVRSRRVMYRVLSAKYGVLSTENEAPRKVAVPR